VEDVQNDAASAKRDQVARRRGLALRNQADDPSGRVGAHSDFQVCRRQSWRSARQDGDEERAQRQRHAISGPYGRSGIWSRHARSTSGEHPGAVGWQASEGKSINLDKIREPVATTPVNLIVIVYNPSVSGACAPAHSPTTRPGLGGGHFHSLGARMGKKLYVG